MPRELSLDFETYCDLDIRKVGLDAYTSHPSFEVLMAAYRIDGGPLKHWQAYEGPVPRDLKDALLDPSCKRWAFNAAFERLATRRGLTIKTPIVGWRCTMVLSYMHSFTGGLVDVASQMGIPEDLQKKKTGSRLIKIFCGPQKPTKRQPHVRRDRNTDPEEWDQFVEYNKQDVVAEEAIKARLIKYPVLEDEWSFYGLDQLINDRGMPVDLDFVRNVKAMSERRRRELLDEIEEMTGLENGNSVQQLLPWLQDHGYPYVDVRQENVRKALNRSEELWGCFKDAPDEEVESVVRVLRRRLWAAKTSTKKANAALNSVGVGDRIRYMFQFCGASRTARFAGRNVQPQNMTRTPKIFDPEHNSSKLDCATDRIRRGDYAAFRLYVDEPMMAFTGCMRGMFRTPDGNEFQVCDYSSIESVALAWMTGCEKLLDIFRSGKDGYRFFGSMIYKKRYEDITPYERQISKPGFLGCGYRLGSGRLVDGRKTGLLAYAENMGIEMTQEESNLAVNTFRKEFPEVVDFWYECENAVRHVLRTHKPYQLKYFRFEWMKPYLLIRLPSGRYIYYYKPKLEERIVTTDRVRPVYENGRQVGEEPETYTRTVFTYMGRNQKKNKWERIEAHGGVTTENLDQALCRDILKVGMQRIHKAGFRIVGHAHDEIITEQQVGDSYYNWHRMREIMREPIEWAPGFPLNAAGWSGPYYRKA